MELRSSIPPEEHALLSRRICESLLQTPELASARCIHVFWPLAERKEVDIRPYIRHLRASGVVVVLPVIHAFTRKHIPGGRMHNVELGSNTRLVVNKKGIHEPEAGRIVSNDEIDAVLVPALGVDRAGYRLGYGMGYYDEFLSEINAALVCPIFSRCTVERIPRERHDIPVQMVVTEDGPFHTTPV